MEVRVSSECPTEPSGHSQGDAPTRFPPDGRGASRHRVVERHPQPLQWHTMCAMLLLIAMPFQERGVEPQSFLVPVFLLPLNPLSLSERDVASHAGARSLLFCVPNWKVLSETLSSHVESHENGPPRSGPREIDDLVANVSPPWHPRMRSFIVSRTPCCTRLRARRITSPNHEGGDRQIPQRSEW